MRKRITPYKQRLNYDCGPACVKMILDYYGIPHKYYEILERCKARPNWGSESTDIVKALKKYGLKAKEGSLYDIDHLRRWHKEKKLVIVMYWLETAGHYSIVANVGKKNITLADPDKGNLRYLPLSDFRCKWFVFNSSMAKSTYYLVNKLHIALRCAIVVSK